MSRRQASRERGTGTRRAGRSRNAPRQPEQILELTIDELGHRGDGIAHTEKGRIYVPCTLAGERIVAAISGNRGVLQTVLEPSPERIQPLCRHFARCGSCAFQHWSPAPYRAWKRQLVVDALQRNGLDCAVGGPVETPVSGRRRAVFAARSGKGGLVLGYHERAGNNVVDIAECPVLVPELQKTIGPLKELLKPLIGGRAGAKVTVTASEAGLDVNVDGAVLLDDPAVLTRVTAAATASGVVRLIVDGERLLQLSEPAQDFGGTRVVPPPGGFLQASKEAEEALWQAVDAAIGGARKVADLFAGCGTFALRLARKAPVLAVEGDAAALAALVAAARQPGLKTVTTQRRDLFAEPLLADELNGFDAVVFDPPFAGAAAQAAELAKSRVARIVGVSCNPETFARDARTLADGGFRLVNVTPVDQFVFSPHIELVGTFNRE